MVEDELGDGPPSDSRLVEILGAIRRHASVPKANNDDFARQKRQADYLATLLVELYAGEALSMAKKLEKAAANTVFARHVRKAVQRIMENDHT